MTDQERSSSTTNSASTALPRTGTTPNQQATYQTSRATGAFTKAGIQKLNCPQDRTEAFFWDANCRGFGLRAMKSGRRSWIFQYRDTHGRTRRIVLGDVSAVPLDVARTAARSHAASVTQGGNPSVQRKQHRATSKVLDLIDGYLAHARSRQRPRSFSETERHLLKHAKPLHHERVDAIRRRDVAAVLERVARESGLTAANRVRAAMSALWSWGMRTGLIECDSNPVAYTIRQPEKSRDRTLCDPEIRAIWEETAGGGDYARIVRLCLLTGCRREEIGGLRWDEISADYLVISPERMKGDTVHEIPLLPMIMSALPPRTGAEGFVFGRRGSGYSGWSKSKAALDAKLSKAGSEVSPWRLHDLRRTFSTRLHDIGVEPIVVEALLAHKQQGVAGVYNRASFRDAKRAALMHWHQILTELVQECHACASAPVP